MRYLASELSRRGSPIPTAPQLIVLPPSQFAGGAATEIARLVERATRARGRCALCLSGGRTPRPVCEALAEPPLVDRLDWNRIAIYFADERCVPPDDPRSNYGMVRAALLDRVAIPDASIHRMHGENPDRDAAAREYESSLPDSLDVLVLGMGVDGHTASLFPRSAALAERDRSVVVAEPPDTSPVRLTITPPVIAAAERRVVLVTGADKAAIVARALEGPYVPDEIPVQLAREATWILDTDAGRE